MDEATTPIGELPREKLLHPSFRPETRYSRCRDTSGFIAAPCPPRLSARCAPAVRRTGVPAFERLRPNTVRPGRERIHCCGEPTALSCAMRGVVAQRAELRPTRVADGPF